MRTTRKINASLQDTSAIQSEFNPAVLNYDFKLIFLENIYAFDWISNQLNPKLKAIQFSMSVCTSCCGHFFQIVYKSFCSISLKFYQMSMKIYCIINFVVDIITKKIYQKSFFFLAFFGLTIIM